MGRRSAHAHHRYLPRVPAIAVGRHRGGRTWRQSHEHDHRHHRVLVAVVRKAGSVPSPVAPGAAVRSGASYVRGARLAHHPAPHHPQRDDAGLGAGNGGPRRRRADCGGSQFRRSRPAATDRRLGRDDCRRSQFRAEWPVVDRRFAGLAITVLALAFNLAGDVFRDVTDPKADNR